VFLRWSEVVVTFDEADHPDHTPYPGHFHLLVSPNIGQTHLTKVLMDSGSCLNLLYAEMYDTMAFSRATLQPSDDPFYGVILGAQAVPLGWVDLPITFGSRRNFRMEILTFETFRAQATRY
jgi:hypothetical protein